MRETVSYYPVRFVKTIRIVCHQQDCLAATEIPVERVEAVMKKTGGCCPVCGKPFTNPAVEGGADVVSMLARVAQALGKLTTQLRIELPIGDE